MKAPAVIPKVCRHVLLCVLDFSVGQPPLPPLTPNGWVLHHSLKLTAKFTFKLKKVGKTSRPLRCYMLGAVINEEEIKSNILFTHKLLTVQWSSVLM